MRSKTWIIACAMAMFVLSQTAYGRVFINEVDYDNPSTDDREFIELAGSFGSSLTGWTIQLVNGSGGGAVNYGPAYSLGNFVFANETGPNWGLFVIGPTATVANVDVNQTWASSSGVQNGNPDGIRLINAQGVVVQ